jgi:hypothetical protein
MPARQRDPEHQRRLVAVKPKKGSVRRSEPTGRVLLSPETAAVFRAAAKYLGITLDELAQRMLQDYLPRHASQLDLILDDDTVIEPGTKTERRGVFASDAKQRASRAKT